MLQIDNKYRNLLKTFNQMLGKAQGQSYGGAMSSKLFFLIILYAIKKLYSFRIKVNIFYCFNLLN